jgi:hypothetical protein
LCRKGRTISKRAASVGIVGVFLVVAYAGLGALQILVLNPLAAAPGLTLGEIHAVVTTRAGRHCCTARAPSPLRVSSSCR